MGFDSNAYINQYKRDNYYIARTLLPIDKRDALQAYASAHGVSMSMLILQALTAYTGIDLSRKD